MQTRFSVGDKVCGANGSDMQKYNSGVGTVMSITVSSDGFAVQERIIVDFKGDSAEFAAKDALFDMNWVFAIDQKVPENHLECKTMALAFRLFRHPIFYMMIKMQTLQILLDRSIVFSTFIKGNEECSLMDF